FTKTDATTGEELEGAKLQIIDQDGNIVEEFLHFIFDNVQQAMEDEN
ncbi:MAG TPA: hypothetical protein IAA83_08725, partial [Candidatus Avoscillospira avistercoris]|nr:hypothetical protein [Candidatus Avoscillospira avistercoris]